MHEDEFKCDGYPEWSWRPQWFLLFVWAGTTVIVWGLIISVIGVTVGTSSALLSGVHFNLKEVLSSSGGNVDLITYFLASVLLATGTEVAIPLGFGISGGIQATGYIHFVVIMATFVYAGHSVNQAEGDSRAALYLAIAHGAVMWAIALMIFAINGGEVDIRGWGLDAAWRYALMGLIVGVGLMFWERRGAAGQVSLSDQIKGAIDGLQGLVSPKGAGGSVPTASPSPGTNSSPPAISHSNQASTGAASSAPALDEGQIAARNAWQAAVKEKNFIYCPECGCRSNIWDPQNFCGHCGHVRGIPTPEVECIGKCGAKVSKTDKFCFRCGAKQPV